MSSQRLAPSPSSSSELTTRPLLENDDDDEEVGGSSSNIRISLSEGRKSSSPMWGWVGTGNNASTSARFVEVGRWILSGLAYLWGRRNFRYCVFAFLLILLLMNLNRVYNRTAEGRDPYGDDNLHIQVSRGKDSLFQIPPHDHQEVGSPRDFTIPKKPYEWYEDTCFPSKKEKYGRTITDVNKKLEHFKNSKKPECHEIWTLFDTIFHLEFIEAPIVLPKDFKPEVREWLGGNEALFQDLYHQDIFKFVMRKSHEETAFNPLRSKRPVSKPSVNVNDYIANLSASTQPSCDFCKYKQHTASDPFGRIDHKYSASASNTFKLAKYHGLFFTKTHHPVNISFSALKELFLETSQEWFEKAHQADPTQVYPTLLWDVLPHAGASQVHPHVHGLLGGYQYSGGFEKLHELSQEYHKNHRRSYWSDIILIHWALGLGLQFGGSVAITPVFARKDHEYMILAPAVNQEFVTLLHAIIEGYKSNLGVYCFSSGGAYHYMGKGGGGNNDGDNSYLQPGLPVVYRIGSRGTCTSLSSDVSSLELYTINNINSDISATYDSLKKSLAGFVQELKGNSKEEDDDENKHPETDTEN